MLCLNCMPETRIEISPLAGPLPKISVVTPSLNQGRFVRRAIESVLEQNYPNLEYFIEDGGSSDQSVSIIQEYAAQLTAWRSGPDGGQSDAINRGFAKATGEIVAWLNADDYYLPGALAAVAEQWKQKPGAAFYFGDGLRVDEEEKALGGYFPGGVARFNRPALQWGLNYILQPACFINHQVLLKAGPLETDLHWGMDTDLWLRLSALAEPTALQRQLAATREYGSTKTSTGSFRRIEELRGIGQKHTQCPLTPGTLLYWLDTLHRLAGERPDIYGEHFISSLNQFWAASATLLQRWGARPDGFPHSDSPPTSPPAGAGKITWWQKLRWALTERKR